MDYDIRPRRWPWLVAGVVVALAVMAAVHYRNVAAREAFERRYPIVSSAAEVQVLKRGLDRWRLSAVLGRVAAPPAFEALELLGPCGVHTENLWRYRVGDVERVKDVANIPLEEARRGRYRTDNDRTWVLAHLTEPILVASVAAYEAPSRWTLDRTDYYPGSRSGVAYLFDIDGTLLCAGTYAATSSKGVDLSFVPNEFPPDYQLSLLQAKLVDDLEDQTALAIATGLRQVRPALSAHR